ncbi:MAG: hypothetical protein GKR93_04785 [Gammaproteobacteria bacterium]|nr:hypothetical protein [Gammaproteobacteria bacterium]
MEEGKRTVPDRMLGCWKRRYIKFKNGDEDTATRVIWLQTLSEMVDIRIPERVLDFSRGHSLRDYSYEQLLELAEQDCGNAITTLDESSVPYATASWDSDEHDASIQSIVIFPEDGWFDWREKGQCMMEWAPSGDYEEDWRLQADSRSYIAHYKNLNPEKSEFVFLTGEHAVFVKGRTELLNEERHLRDIVTDNRDNRAYLEALLDIEFSYARRKQNNQFQIELSSLPFREGQFLELGYLLDMGLDEQKITQPDNQDTWLRVCQWKQI